LSITWDGTFRFAEIVSESKKAEYFEEREKQVRASIPFLMRSRFVRKLGRRRALDFEG